MPVKIDTASSTLTYIGVTRVSNLTSDPVWTILRLTDIGNDTDIETPTDAIAKNAIWDNRTTYNYG